MTKTELMETYTAEQLADKYLRLQERFNQYTEVIQDITNKLPEELKQGTKFHLEIDRLQSEVKKYRKAFEDAKKERECQIVEYRKKIDELEKKSDFCFPEEPIKIADLLIHGWETSLDYKHFSVSELRQIAEHLLVYCNNQKENVDE